MNFQFPKTNLEWLPSRTLLLVRHGSHAYGTSTPTSDLDFKGVAIPPDRYYHGITDRFEQAEFRDPYDMVVFEIRKFFALAADCNPSMLEVLFSDPEDHVLVSRLGRDLLESRSLFLSKKAKHTFSGYAISQLKRIQTHRRWLLNPPKAPPTRAEMGLPERTVIPADQLSAAQSMIRKKVEAWECIPTDELDAPTRVAVQNRFVEALAEIQVTQESLPHLAGKALGFDDNFLHLLDLERSYNGRKIEWDQYQNWVKTRNPARAALEIKYGYDTKHGMHLVRLMRMCRETLETGKVLVKRPDAEELLAIRNGAWTYDRLIEWAQKQETELEALYRTSKILPMAPDRALLSYLCQNLIEDSFR